MKTPSKNPNAMKNTHEPNFYFSAYPLKALNLPEEEKKSYLHINKKDNKGNPGFSVHSKILPMSLAAHEQAVIKSKKKQKTQPDNIEERESEWFASYE